MSTIRSDTTKSAWDRRELLVAAVSAAAVTYLPFGAVAAPPAIGATRAHDALVDWSIDDQWGVYPRYDAIATPPQQADDQRLASVHPADRAFVA
jgi:hypothetical protein